MAYVGTPIDTTNTFQSLTGDRFDGDGSAVAFTLSTAPASTLDIEVFVGNVRQDPNSAYTVSGTTLTFTGAPPSGTNNIYVVHQAKAVGTIDVPTGGVQSGSLASAFLTGQTDIGAGIADADLFLVDDGAGGTLRKVAASRIKTYAATTSATNSFAITGTTPTLTIGDEGAEDTKVIFKGNVRDYHIGLDDSADNLVIGKGSTLGTNTALTTDGNGHVTTPLNPAFRVAQSTSGDFANGHAAFNGTGGITEQYDVNADLAGNGTFTAPVTGKYLFTIGIADANSTDDTSYDMRLMTSNRNYRWGIRNKFEDNTTGVTTMTIKGSVLVDMDVSDTCFVEVAASATITIEGNVEHSFFSGVLIG